MKRRIYVDIPRKNTIEEYLRVLFQADLPTSYYERYLKPTYLNKKLTILDHKYGRRSLEDIITIVHTEYNELPVNIIKSLVIEGIKVLYQEGKCKTLYCPDIQKLVFYNSNSFKSDQNGISKYRMHHVYHEETDIEKKGQGEYCLKEVLDLMGYENNYKIEKLN